MKRIKHGGRQAGTPNKMTSELREILKGIFCNHIEKLPEELSQLTVKERLDFIIKLLPYIMPKLETIPISEKKEFKEITPQTAGTMTREEMLE